MEIITTSVQAQTLGGHDPCQGDFVCTENAHDCMRFLMGCMPICECHWIVIDWCFFDCPPISIGPHSIFERN